MKQRATSGFLASVLLGLALLLCACTQDPVALEKVQDNLGFLESADGELVLALNTETNITTTRPDLRDALVGEAQDQIHYIHKRIDAHHAYVVDGQAVINVAYLNEHFGEGPFKIDPVLFDCLDEACRMAELTKGYFNPTIGKLVDLYEGKFSDLGAVQENPSSTAIEEALASVVPYDALRDYIVLDQAKSTVELLPYNGQEFRLSLGAIGKGYALSALDVSLASSYLVSAGASSIRGRVVEHEDEITWNVAVREPDSSDLLLAFHLDNGAVSTSGDDENYYLLEDGTRVHHILNPFTGTSESFYREVVIVGPDAGVLDALSTALFNIEDEQEVLATIARVEEHYGTTIDYAFVVDEGGGMYQLRGSEGFRERIIPEYVSDRLNPRMYIMDENTEAEVGQER